MPRQNPRAERRKICKGHQINQRHTTSRLAHIASGFCSCSVGTNLVISLPNASPTPTTPEIKDTCTVSQGSTIWEHNGRSPSYMMKGRCGGHQSDSSWSSVTGEAPTNNTLGP